MRFSMLALLFASLSMAASVPFAQTCGGDDEAKSGEPHAHAKGKKCRKNCKHDAHAKHKAVRDEAVKEEAAKAKADGKT